MRVTIFGSGYVGLVTGACLADAGNHVICVDVDATKIERLSRGEVPIHEPGLEALIKRNAEAGRIEFTTDAPRAIEHGLFHLIAVGTPRGEDGSADLRYVLAAARTIATHLNRYGIVITKSTVPVGTADKVHAELERTLDGRGVKVEFDVVSNPEFLKEGAAIADFMKPDRVVVGTDNPRTTELMRALYEPFIRNHDRLIVMDIRSCELTKYAANAMLATKISFMNELANIAERVGADIEKVRIGIGSDPRIGYSFIYPGTGYGGSCFPKDVQALIRSAHEAGHEPEILNAVEAVNARQKEVLFRKMQRHFTAGLEGRTVAVWGLAFKPNTDDMREAPSRTLIELLLEAGARTSPRVSRVEPLPYGDSPSNPTPTTCGKRPHARSSSCCSRPAPGCRPMTRWRPRRRNASMPARRASRWRRMPTRPRRARMRSPSSPSGRSFGAPISSA